jgi:hypothetical protein
MNSRRVRKTGAVSTMFRAVRRFTSTRRPKAALVKRKVRTALIKDKYVQQTFHIVEPIKAKLTRDGQSYVLLWGQSNSIQSLLTSAIADSAFPAREEYVDFALESIKTTVIPFPGPVHGTLHATGCHVMALAPLSEGQRGDMSTFLVGNIAKRQFSKLRPYSSKLSMVYKHQAFARRHELNKRISIEDMGSVAKIKEYLGTRVPDFIYGSYLNCADMDPSHLNREIVAGYRKVVVKLSFRGRK